MHAVLAHATTRPKPFRDWNYCYWLNGKRLYSPARVLRDLGLKTDYSAVNAYDLRRAAWRGKLVEDYCYRLLRGERVTVRAKHCGSLQADVAARVEAFYRWMVQVNPVYVDHQTIVWSARDRIAWTRDLRVRINGVLWLVDIKCTSLPAKDWPLQLGCGLAYDEDGCSHAAILQLKPSMSKKGYKFRDAWKGPQLVNWWERAVERWQSERDFNYLKSELGFDSEAFGLETEDDE